MLRFCLFVSKYIKISLKLAQKYVCILSVDIICSEKQSFEEQITGITMDNLKSDRGYCVYLIILGTCLFIATQIEEYNSHIPPF